MLVTNDLTLCYWVMIENNNTIEILGIGCAKTKKVGILLPTLKFIGLTLGAPGLSLTGQSR
jgi:hypothetical protein